jgi:hypothetical protein
MAVIREDFLGLYVRVGGYIARPLAGTVFNVRDKVKARHFGGSSNVGITIESQNFKNGNYELWQTTIPAHIYKDKIFDKKFEELYQTAYTTFEEYLVANYKWCIKYTAGETSNCANE